MIKNVSEYFGQLEYLKNTIWGKREGKGESEEDVKMGREQPEGEVSTCGSHGREKRRIRKWQKESERQKWYHMYITSTRGRQDNFRLQAGFTPVNGVILTVWSGNDRPC